MFLKRADDAEVKNSEELSFWKSELQRYVKWSRGKIILYGSSKPKANQIIHVRNSPEKGSAMTWNRVFQQEKYLNDLILKSNTFANMRVCDVGSGPHPSSLCFTNAELYGIDHLMEEYGDLGYPINEYPKRYHFIKSKSEQMPFPSKYFDAVICVNAIDHVDDIIQTSLEIKRVLKEKGLFRMHVHYHNKTLTEPLELNDRVFTKTFSWVKKLHKVKETIYKDNGGTKAAPGELYVVWSNF